jgi:hypothetical protein
MMSVDLLREVELGVWRAAFTRLIRMLESLGTEKSKSSMHGMYFRLYK